MYRQTETFLWRLQEAARQECLQVISEKLIPTVLIIVLTYDCRHRRSIFNSISLCPFKITSIYSASHTCFQNILFKQEAFKKHLVLFDPYWIFSSDFSWLFLLYCDINHPPVYITESLCFVLCLDGHNSALIISLPSAFRKNPIRACINNSCLKNWRKEITWETWV